MSLPWFPFHLDAYIGDTMHLTTEEHGAYLLLIVAYYRTGKPLPASDRALASITKLPMDRWLEAKPSLSGFFREHDGYWHHDRIDREMLEASSKHAQSIARAEAAAAARWQKKANKDAPSMPQASSKHAQSIENAQSNASSNASSMLEASSEECLENAHKHKQDRRGGVGNARARARATVQPPPEPDPSPPEVPEPPPDPGPSPFGTPIDGWVPRPGSIAPDDLPVLNAFAAEHREAGTFSTDWDAAFARYRAAAGAGKSPKPHAKPRLELTKRPEPPVGQRLLITDEAFRLADAVLAAARIEEGSRGSFGAPALMQAWLAAWSADTILSTVRNVMADGRERPSTLKYFERAIARAHAELAGPRPVATAAEVREIAHATRHKTNSVAAAAAELAAEFAALSGGGTDDGAGQGAVAGGPVPQVGCG